MAFEANKKQIIKLADLKINSGTEYISTEIMAVLSKVEAIHDGDFNKCSVLIEKGCEKVRLQFGEHGGSSVFFNKEGDTRFGLSDGVTGTLYLANDPPTAMKEVFQNKLSILESDLNNYYMGIVVIEKDLQVVDLAALISFTRLTLHDVTTAWRCVTQCIAKKACSAGQNGILFSSNVTTEKCLALWHHDPSGKGIASTKSQTRLSEFEYQGEATADILVDKLGISVEE